MTANIRSEFPDCQWYQWQPMAANSTTGKITIGTIGKTPHVPIIIKLFLKRRGTMELI